MKRAIIILLLVLFASLYLNTPLWAKLDKYGGYTGLKGTNTSGYFRTEKIGNKYWFVTPDNHVFWLTGMCWWVYIPTILEDKDKAWRAYFYDCPSLGYRPVELNQRAKYKNYADWLAKNTDRMRKWGFNTVACGGWFYKNPYPDTYEIVSITDAARGWGTSTTLDYNVGIVTWPLPNGQSQPQINAGTVALRRFVPSVNDNFADVFDPQFEINARTAVEVSTVPDNASNHWRIGIFPDSEIRWNYRLIHNRGLADAYITQRRGTYAKAIWLSWLQRKYTTLGDLNNAYGTSFSSWDDPGDDSSVSNLYRIQDDDAGHSVISQDKIAFVDDTIFADCRTMQMDEAVVPVVLPDCFIALPADCSGKQYWVNSFLKSRYIDLQALNTAYGTSFTSWNGSESTSVANILRLKDDPAYPAIHNDKLDFMTAIAERYYSTAAKVIKQSDPNHLIFSERYSAWWNQQLDSAITWDFNNRVFTAAGKYCDVLCANTYHDTQALDSSKYQLWSRMFKYGKKPIMITENSYSGDDTILPNQTWWENDSPTQVGRGRKYIEQLQFAGSWSTEDPNSPGKVYPWVGITWFDYYDSPSLKNRGNEDTNYGLVSVMEEPYSIMTAATSTVNSQIYDHRAKGKQWSVFAGPALSSPSEGAKLASSTPSFKWEACLQDPVLGGAVAKLKSYELLISPESSFPEDQTIRVNAGAKTSYMYTRDGGLANGTWYWTVGAIDNAGHRGQYAQPRKLMVKTLSADPAKNLACSQVTGWNTVDTTDTGGAASSFVFLDNIKAIKGQKTSTRIVFTSYSYNKITKAKNNGDAKVYASLDLPGLDWSGYSHLVFRINPNPFSHPANNGGLVSPTGWLTVSLYNAETPDTPVLSVPLDPDGTLPINQWSTVTIPLKNVKRNRINRIVFSSKCRLIPAWDQRLIFNIGHITPMAISSFK